MEKANSRNIKRAAALKRTYKWTVQTDSDCEVHSTIDYPGVIVDLNTIEKDFDVLKGVKIPVRLHFKFQIGGNLLSQYSQLNMLTLKNYFTILAVILYTIYVEEAQ
ncbi:hypothetical protein [Paenibacillus etheri]|uniref:Uncharacterized protein n=1 Tax=Paenibacillus etheri TaxID=1306852 RepID=A0A0W1AXD4_9BACL|nr:hypothetical protein [Paenibacillus etheri]KTD85920.1 hypothetical protein UQ64_17650 [Paenibacillus etheri]